MAAAVAAPAAQARPVITSAPANPSAETTARFKFSAGGPLRCRLDRGRETHCRRKVTYRALAEGRHVFSVRARGRRARTTYAWTIDLARPPRPTLTERPGELSASATARFAFSVAEPGVALRCALDGGPSLPCASPVTYDALADGVHRFTVVALDAAGNESRPATHGWTVDTQPPPAPTIVTAPAALSASPDARFQLSTAEAGVELRCRLDGSPTACSALDGLAEGEHVFVATAVDAAGNESAPTTYRWAIDVTPPPAPALTGRPAGAVPRSTATFSFTGGDPAASYVCRLDDAPPLPCSSPQRYSGLTVGPHTFAVWARDPAGHRSAEAAASWTVVPTRYRDEILAEPGLAGYWRLGEATWAPAADQAGARPGAYSGGVTLGAAGAILDDPDTAVAFDGASGEVLLPGPVLSADGTLEAWIDWRAGIAVLRDHSGAGGWILAYDSGGTVMTRAAGRTLDTGVAVASLRNGWHHLVLTKAGPQLTFFLDGRQTATTGGAANTASAAPWHVMNNGTFSEQYARGHADEVAVYTRALDPRDVADHFALGRGDAGL